MRVGLTKRISLNSSLPDDELSPTKINNSPGAGMTPQILEKYNTVHFEYIHLGNILSRAHSLRSHNQLRFLSEFAKRNQALKELSELTGPDFSKGILRSASIQQYRAEEVIEWKNTPIERVYVILEGKLGVIKNQDETDMISEMSRKDVYEHLTAEARSEMKRHSKLSRKLSSLRQDFQCSHQLYDKYSEANFIQFYERFETFGDKSFCLGRTHPHTVVSTQSCLLLTVNIKNFMYWINHEFERKLEVSFEVLRRHPCFSWVSNELLESIVQILSVVRTKKGDIIYQQGSEATHIFFLQEGQVKITKKSQLFLENPNELYLDRRTIMNEQELNNKEYLAYADLHLLYNFTPISKVLDIGILTPGCLFGEEEIVENRERSTTTRFSSLKGAYFSLELKKLYQILGDKSSKFITGIKDSLKEKVRYRQNTYAATINFENKKNLTYFYEGPTHNSPRKKNISKINEKIVSLNHSQEKRGQSLVELDKKVNNELKKVQIPASYNTFNFHRMLKTKLSKVPLKEDSSSSQQDQQSAKDNILDEEARQRKIVHDSHTWKLVREKVQMETRLSRKLGTLKHKINFDSPLIDGKYFIETQKILKKLEREKKAGKFDSSLNKSRFKVRSKSFVSSLTPR